MIGDGGHADTIHNDCGPEKTAAIVAIGDNRTRKRVVEETWNNMAMPSGGKGRWQVALARNGYKVPTRKEQEWVGEGTVILDFSYVCKTAIVGKHCIVNHHACVEHDAVLGDFVHVAPGAKVLGRAKVGEGALIGANAVVLPGAVVPAWAIVRACSVFPSDYLAWEDGGPDKGEPLGAYSRFTLKFQPEK